MTRGQLIFSVSRKAGLDDTAASEERTLMETWANDGVVEVLLQTHCYVRPGSVALQAGVRQYDIDPNILAITDLQLASSGWGDYERLSMDELRDMARQEQTRKAFAVHYGLFLINPAPASSDTMDILFVPRPAKMTQDSHDPSDTQYGGIPSQYHRAIEYYMLWQAAEYDEKRLPEAPKDYKQQFLDECGDVRKRGRGMGTRRLNPARVGYPASGRTGSRNDIYPTYDR